MRFIYSNRKRTQSVSLLLARALQPLATCRKIARLKFLHNLQHKNYKLDPGISPQDECQLVPITHLLFRRIYRGWMYVSFCFLCDPLLIGMRFLYRCLQDADPHRTFNDGWACYLHENFVMFTCSPPTPATACKG